MTTDTQLAHGLARLGLGVNIAIHGFARLPQVAEFAAGMEQKFAATFLPGPLVYVTGYGILIGEAVIGVLLILGFLLRPALVGGTLLMILLLTGTCLLQNWEIAGLQMVYLGFYAVLLATMSHDRYSLDHLLKRNRAS